ncbi:ABC transporter permease [Lysinibacillus sp. 54212]|uniref:ABC transporter permease n=1 Tax=Lysinibacillus sp. 54212 TaxID=3119829 RepID=UPI002FC6BAC8
MRVVALVTRITQQMIRDKRTLALLFIAPLFVLSLMYFIFNSNESKLTLAVSNSPANVMQKLEQTSLSIIEVKDYSESKLRDDNFDGWLNFQEQGMLLTLLNDNPSAAKAIQTTVAKAMQSQASLINDINYIYGDENTVIFDVFSPMLIGFFVFFFVFLITGISLLKERTTGTLERLLATPIKRSEIVLGYLIGYGFFALIQTVVIVLYGIYILDIVHVGSIWLVLLINILVAIVALSLGALLSSFAGSEFQMMQFIPLVIVPQVFFSGLFPLDNMVDWLQKLGQVMPLYYAADALNGVMYKGLTIGDIAINLGVLVSFAFVFILLNIISLKKYRSI